MSFVAKTAKYEGLRNALSKHYKEVWVYPHLYWFHRTCILENYVGFVGVQYAKGTR